MNNNDIIKEWLRFSETDLAAAQHLYNNMYPKPLEIICYHCDIMIHISNIGKVL